MLAGDIHEYISPADNGNSTANLLLFLSISFKTMETTSAVTYSIVQSRLVGDSKGAPFNDIEAGNDGFDTVLLDSLTYNSWPLSGGLDN